jgi:putative transposase
MKDNMKAEEIAALRVQLLSPLLADGLDPAKAIELRKEICNQSGLSDRTIRRYLASYRTEGFEGLKPKGKAKNSQTEAISEELVNEAIVLRREVPSRSVAQIIQILEWEGLAAPGQIRRSTLQDKLTERGFSSRHMKMYAGGGLAARRFQKKSRNKLWHSDIKYGPYLPIGPGGSPKQVYLVTFFDDATRFVLHGEFYPSLDKTIVEDCFRQAIQKFGVPESVYFDNGKQYRTKWMKRACAKLGVRLMYARPYSPEGTGKIEKFNRTVDSFLNEFELEKHRTLDRLNDLFGIWLDECYQNKPHSALKNNISPENAFRIDSASIRYLEPSVVADAFLHCEERKVDKAGCINFDGKKYEVGVSFIGCKVNVIYDPSDTTEITIEYEGHAPIRAQQLVIGERTGKRPKLPEHLTTIKAKESRLLKEASKKNDQRKSIQTPAISFRRIGKAGV